MSQRWHQWPERSLVFTRLVCPRCGWDEAVLEERTQWGTLVRCVGCHVRWLGIPRRQETK